MKIRKNLFGKGDKIHANEIAVAPGLLLGNAIIVESGSNSNGRFIKFGDGTMICFGMGSFVVPALSQGLHNLWRNANIGNFNFPERFQEVIFADMKILASEEINVAMRSLDTSYFSAALVATSDISGTTRNYYLFAIGRWK